MAKEASNPSDTSHAGLSYSRFSAVLFVLTLLPARVRLLPSWTPYAFGIALLVPIAGVWLSGADARWLRIERATTLVFSLLVGGRDPHDRAVSDHSRC